MTLALIALVVLFILGTPIFALMLAGGALGAMTTTRGHFLDDYTGQLIDLVRLGTGEHAQVLSTIPLFIFTGFLMAESKTADRLVRAAQAALGWLPGGLAVVTVFACALFTTFTGASGVTIVALGGLLMPSLLKENYPERFSSGLVAGTGSIGLLFPPALPLIIYGTVYALAAQIQAGAGESIGFSSDSFLYAGIVPGLVLLSVISAYSVFVAIRNKVPRQAFDAKSLIHYGLRALPEMALPFLVILGMAKGIAIPEIAALATVYIFILETVVFRDLKLRTCWRLIRQSMALVGSIFIIIFAAQALTNFFVTADVPKMIFEFIRQHFDNKWSFLFALNIFLILVGMMMDIFSAIVIVVPLITPLALHYGIDPYHLGVVFLLNLELGYITPPVGLNLFIAAYHFKKPVAEVIRSTLPFLLCIAFSLVLVTYIPALTVVPEPPRRGQVSQIAKDIDTAYQALSAVAEVTMPNGNTKKLSECAAIQNELDKESCRGLFVDITKCRKLSGPEEINQCESGVLSEWMELNSDDSEDSDLGTEDSDDDFDDLFE